VLPTVVLMVEESEVITETTGSVVRRVDTAAPVAPVSYALSDIIRHKKSQRYLLTVDPVKGAVVVPAAVRDPPVVVVSASVPVADLPAVAEDSALGASLIAAAVEVFEAAPGPPTTDIVSKQADMQMA